MSLMSLKYALRRMCEIVSTLVRTFHKLCVLTGKITRRLMAYYVLFEIYP